jgi:hypothetical protein
MRRRLGLAKQLLPYLLGPKRIIFGSKFGATPSPAAGCEKFRRDAAKARCTHPINLCPHLLGSEYDILTAIFRATMSRITR